MTRIILFLAIVAFNVASFAASSNVIVVVSEIKGNAFYSLGGSTKVLKPGMYLPAKTEIFTEVGSQVAFNDYYDHVFYLSGGAHLIVYPNLVELKEGYLWVKSLAFDALKGPLKVTTANSLIEHTKGEGIISFDTFSGKTQVLSIKGDFDLKNIRQEYQWTQVAEGQFSFIQDEYNKGTPRQSTPIGYASYKKVTSLFEGVDAFDKAKTESSLKAYPSTTTKAVATRSNATKSRGIASVEKVDPFEEALRAETGEAPTHTNTTTGTTTVLKLRNPQQEKAVEKSLMKFYKNKVSELGRPQAKKKWTPSYDEKSGVKVKIFGRGATHSSSRAGARMPASVRPVQPAQTNRVTKSYKKKYRTPASIGLMAPSVNTSGNGKFENELVDQYKKQMRHDQEVNELIDQLKSIDMDYKKEY